jgi:hypothetical protein
MIVNSSPTQKSATSSEFVTAFSLLISNLTRTVRTGYSELFTQPAAQLRREGSHMEVQVLSSPRQGLTRFLKSVTWRDPLEVKQAVEELLPMWTEIDTDDALELLGPSTVDSRVRAFAVKQLSRADDDGLNFTYLARCPSSADA